MAKKKTAVSGQLAEGTRVRVRAGVTAPEFPEVSCEGWTGQVAEPTGKTGVPKYLIEWDDTTLRRMPDSYKEQCEQRQLFYRMACLTAEQIEPLDT